MKTTKQYFNELAKATDVFYELSDEEHALLKKCLLNMYLDVAAVCNKYNLCIMLGGGSALGAVRHQGFIPWDDDLDALMPRKDYNKLIEVFGEELGEHYILSVPRTDREMALSMTIEMKNTLMSKIDRSQEDMNGIEIDIFPVENAPDNKLARTVKAYIADVFKFVVTSLRFYQNKNPLFKVCFMQTYKVKLYYYIRRFIGLIFSIFPKKYLYSKYDEFVSGGGGTKYCCIPTGRRYYSGEIHPRSVFFPPKEASFEGITVYIPHDPDTYLKNLYGDYMRIPPVEKRERHFYTEFNLDISKAELYATKVNQGQTITDI
jgi:lipopolysaccharide cholinephosphotransferase